jgi:YbbR domain-containing protein
LTGNEAVTDSIKITVGEQVVEPEIYLDPAFNKIREYQTIEFKVKVSVGGKEIEPDTVGVGLENNGNEYLGITQTTSGWKMACYKRSSTPIAVLVDVTSLSHNISKTAKFDIQAVSMMG